jgi:hypothetical protein
LLGRTSSTTSGVSSITALERSIRGLSRLRSMLAVRPVSSDARAARRSAR